MLDRPQILERFTNALGGQGVLTAHDLVEPFSVDWRSRFHGRPLCVLRPDSAETVSAALRICAEAGVEVVPQGGNTSMVGGATPDMTGRQAVVSLARMNRIRAVDLADMAMTLEAGVTVQKAQETALEAGGLFPLSFGAQGSATIGGALSTNAGGNNTVRYGNTRDLMLGLEVVLPDGRIWDGLRALRKDNTGYALRHLFVGAEGTLGIITAAVMKMAPRPRSSELAFCAVRDEDAALSLFRRFRDADEGCVRAFEYMSAPSVDMVLKHIPGAALPFLSRGSDYALVDLISGGSREALRELGESTLAMAMEGGEVLDAAFAESGAQERSLWRLRESQSEAQQREGDAIRNDVSVPVSKAPQLIREASAAGLRVMPGIRPIPFGHIGDGNIHMNFLRPPGLPPAEFHARSAEISGEVNAVVKGFGGSFSAEHGVGQLKVAMLPRWKSEVEMDLLRTLKRAIDPESRLNPGKMLQRPE
jgi:FAD/FMN-containing dehydrogenase